MNRVGPTDPYYYLSAEAALRHFRKRKLSPYELLKAIIERADRVNGTINAFTDVYYEEALKAARRAEQRWMRTDGSPRPLEGIAVAVKDAQRIKGKRTTYGSLAFRNNIEMSTDPMIERLIAAGAIVHARTTTPEFCMSGVCRSAMWGNTLNPWNRAYGPGGSSGGSGAALAAGMTTLATGTDSGGSVRVPASSCGVVGFKPPHGRNPDGWPWNLDRYSHCGPMARTVADVALMQNVVAGPDPRDHDSLPATRPIPRRFGDIAGLRVAFSIDLDYLPVDADVKANTLEALAIFRKLGCKTEQVELGWARNIDRICAHWYNATHFGRQLIWQAKKHPHLLSPDTRKLARAARRASTIDDLPKTIDLANQMYRSLGHILARSDIFICPTMTIPAVRADHDRWDTNFRIDGVKADPEYGYSSTHQFNILQNCPAMSVPSGFSRAGVPTGLQIVGRTFDDLSVFRVASAFERARGLWYGAEDRTPDL